MVLLTKVTSIYFEVNHLTFIGPLLPDVAGSKIDIDECTIIGFLTYARRRTQQILVKLFKTFNAH